MAGTATDMPTLIAGPCSDEPPPPPIPPPQKKPWNCVACSREDTPVKRSGPQGPGTLCNACGIRIRKEKRKLAEAGAAAAAAAAGNPPTHRPPLRRARQKKRPPPKRRSYKRKTHDQPPPMKKQRGDNLDAPPSNTVPSPVVPIHRPPSSPVTTVPSSHARTASPVSSAVATGMVVPLTSAAISTSANRVCPPQSAPLPSTAPSMPSTSPVAVLSSTRTAPAPTATDISINNSPPVSSPTHISTHISGPAAVPPTTPEDVRLLQCNAPPDPLTTLLRQSSQTEESNPEEIITTLGMGTVTMNGVSSESVNRTDKDSFPGSLFAQCDDTGNTSTQVEVVNVFDGMANESNTFPAGTSMVSVEGPYGEEGSMAAPTELVATPGLSVAASTGLAAMANPPVPITTPQSLSETQAAVQPDHMTLCMNTLTRLDLMNTQICQRMNSIDERIAEYARKHEELTLERNEVNLSISQLMGVKDVARKRQHVVLEGIARTTCLLQYLRKQDRRVSSA